MKTQVLIVGAGPTGLMMACQLQRWGIDLIIIDDKETTTNQSRALAVQARSVEIFRQMGMADKAVKHGRKAKALNLVVKDKVRGHIAFEGFGEGLSPYPYLLMLEQNKNEELLNEYLGEHEVNVLWKHALLSFTDNTNDITAIVKDAEGKNIEIQARYIIGADGAKSLVRHQLDMPFEGATYENVFFVADTKVHWKLPQDDISIIISTKTFSAFFPMEGESRYRVVGTMPEKFTDDGSVKFEDIQDTVKMQTDVPVSFSDTSWFSIYRVHHRVVQEFRRGNVFLTGDAAHVHSPVGAQGMNTGLQDAYNLAWKMAWVLKGIAGEALLNSYNEERHRIAKLLVQSTDRAFSIVISPSPWGKFFKFHILPFMAPILMRLTAFKTMMFKFVSQIAVKYPKSSLSCGRSGKLRAGTRFPYFHCLADDGTSSESFDFFKETGIYLITYNIPDVELKLNAELNIFQFSIPFNETNKNALKEIGFGDSFVCVVRPDTYIGYIGDKYEAEAIQNYLSKQLYIKG